MMLLFLLSLYILSLSMSLIIRRVLYHRRCRFVIQPIVDRIIRRFRRRLSFYDVVVVVVVVVVVQISIAITIVLVLRRRRS